MATAPDSPARARDLAFGRALALVRDLRTRCPWDRVQTRRTLRPYFIEEAFELDQALRVDDPVRVRDELGDLLLHLAFQVVIGEERGEFDAEVVTRGLERKMWRRHPRLFGDAQSRTDDHPGWERVKRAERGAGAGVLRGLPETLPPLLAALRLQERAAGVGFDWPSARGPLDKVHEELRELEAELPPEGAPSAAQLPGIADEIGDLLFALVNLARKLGVDPGAALEQANDKFRRRFGAVEALAERRGIDIGRVGLAELDRLWEEVKAQSL